MKRRAFAGLPVVVENEAGSTRQWHDRDGRESGSVVMQFDYGFLEGHVGTDGDEVDCYLGPDEQARFVFVVHQLKAPEFERHDEDKVMLGFASEADAKAAYLAHRNDGDRAYGGMSAIPLEAFVTKLERRTGTGKIRYERSKMPAFDASTAQFALSGPSHAFDAGVGSDGKISINVWDRFTSWGPKHKNEPVEFNETTLGQMVTNWRARGGELAMCQDHKSAAAPLVAAPALAYYDALAIVRDGQVLRFEKLVMSAATPPDPAALKAKVATFATADDPTPEPDGLWGFRSEITPLGEDPREGLRNYRFISPFFTDKGTDEQKNPIGYVLADVAATNTPFQGACPITLSQSHQPSAPRSTEKTMNPEMMKKLGLSDGASAEDKKAALKKYTSECATKMSELEGEEAKKMADDLEGMAAYAEGDDGEKMKKLSAKFRRFSDAPAPTAMDAGKDGDEKKKDEAAKETMQLFAQRLGVQLPVNATREQMMTALQAASVKASDLPSIIESQLARTLAKRDADREAADCVEKSKVLMSQLRDDTPEINRKALESLSKDPKTFESAVALSAPFLRPDTAPTSILFSRMTAGGSPLGGLDAVTARTAAAPRGERVVNNAIGTFRIHGEEFSTMAKQWADAKDGAVKGEIDAMLTETTVGHAGERLIAANRLLKQKRPDLWATAEEWRH